MYSGNDDVVIAKVNVDEQHHHELAKKYKVDDFPTLKFFEKGVKKPLT
jgi:thioredoxin-related protein